MKKKEKNRKIWFFKDFFLIFQPIFQKYLRMNIQKLWYNIKQILIHHPYFFAKKGHIMNKIFFF